MRPPGEGPAGRGGRFRLGRGWAIVPLVLVLGIAGLPIPTPGSISLFGGPRGAIGATGPVSPPPLSPIAGPRALGPSPIGMTSAAGCSGTGPRSATPPGCGGPGASTRPTSTGGANSTPVPETGTNLGNVPVGQDPHGIAVDPRTDYLYVAEFGSTVVSVLNGTDTIGTVTVGANPFGAAYDPANHDVYVTDYGASEVTVVSGMKVVGTVGVGIEPEGVAVDPGTGYVYVADSGSDNVSVLSGTSLVTSLPVGSNPDGVAYSTYTGEVYVADTGNDNVTVISGTSVVGQIAVGTAPSGIAYDPSNDLVYVALSGVGAVETILDQSVTANITVGSGPMAVAYDGANGFVYVANQGPSTVSVLNGTQGITTIGAGAAPDGVAYDPGDGMVFVAASNADELTMISTLLGEAPPQLTDHTRPVDATDVNQTLNISAILWALGSGGIVASIQILPAGMFGCSGGMNVTRFGDYDRLSILCSPTDPGLFTIWINATDTNHARAWGRIVIPVDPALNAPAPTSSLAFVNGLPSADVGQSVIFRVAPTGGSGAYVGFDWSGLGGATCTGLGTASPTCRFPAAGTFRISVEVNDSNLASAFSPSTQVTVYLDPTAALPTANHSSADVGQPVRFFETPSGGSGTFQYTWHGLSSGSCSGLATANPACAFSIAGWRNISVQVTDPERVSATSPSLPFLVYLPPVVADPTVNRTFLDVGQRFQLTTSVVGGFGNYSYVWQGLPQGDCSGTSSNQPLCIARTAGTFIIWPEVIDGNGGLATSPDTLQITIGTVPTIAAPSLSDRHIVVGGSVTMTAFALGGSGNFTYRWGGLPPGCASTTEIVHCVPSAAGTYAVRVTVQDSAGLSVSSTTANLTVAPPALFGGNELALVGIVGVLVAAAVVGGLLAIRRKRRRPPLERAGPRDGFAGPLD